MHDQRIQCHTDTNGTTATDTTRDINRGYFVARFDHHILIGKAGSVILVHIAIDIGARYRVMHLNATRYGHTHRTTNTTGQYRRDRRLICIGNDRGCAACISGCVITDIGNVGSLHHSHTKGCTNTRRATATNRTSNLDQLGIALRLNGQIIFRRYRTIDIGIGCVDQHANRRSARNTS